MPDPLVVPGICRFSVRQTLAGIQVVNVLDLDIDTNPGGDRAVAIHSCAGNILNAWYTNLRNQQVNELVVQDIAWIDLDTANGSIGVRSQTSERSWPQAGTDAGGPLPSFVTGLVKKATGVARGAKSGRMFFAGLPEHITDVDNPNRIAAAALTSLNTSLNNFRTAINHDAGVSQDDYTSRLVVVHKPKIGAPFATQVTALTMNQALTYQTRRRQ